MNRDEIIDELRRAATCSAWWNPASLRAAATALEPPAAAWIDCPETPPEPGCYWEPDPIAALLSEDEVQALRWVIARARANTSNLGFTGEVEQDHRCNAAAAVVDRLATADAFISPVVDRATVEAARDLCATLNANPAAAHHLGMYPDMLPGPLHQIARWAREWKPPSPEPLPRSIEQELRALAASAERAYNPAATSWQRGYRRATTDVLEILDAGEKPDPPPWRCAVCGRPCCAPMKCPECGSQEWIDFEADDDPDLERRVSEAHTGIGALVTRLDDHVDRFVALEGSMIDGLARVRGVLTDRLERRDARLEELETRLAAYGKHLDRAEQARAEQQASTVAELEGLRRRLQNEQHKPE